MTVRELIEKLQTMPQDARVQMGYEGNYESTEPNGNVFVVSAPEPVGTPAWWKDSGFLYAEPGDVFIEGEN